MECTSYVAILNKVIGLYSIISFTAEDKRQGNVEGQCIGQINSRLQKQGARKIEKIWVRPGGRPKGKKIVDNREQAKPLLSMNYSARNIRNRSCNQNLGAEKMSRPQHG